MAASLNLHKLFYTDDGYLHKLRVTVSDQTVLSAAREEIRRTLRTAFANWEQHVRQTELFDSVVAKSDVSLRLPAPKFRIQGSFAYHTANDCQQTPPQQIDQDDGVFLPIGFITTGGGTRPSIASKAYFTIVESALKPLCARMGWTLNPQKPKDTCVRVEINDRLHIDLPLYAVQDDVFEELVEAHASRLMKAADSSAVQVKDAARLTEDVYFALDENEIALAHRRQGWIGSDPRKLEIWFEDAVKLYGPQVRRVCRAFKGLRDAHWSGCELGSICLMAAVVTAFGKVGSLDRNRDDLALLAIGRELVSVLAGPIENPAFPGESDKNLCNGWSTEFRAEVRQAFADASDKLERAIYETIHKGVAIRLAKEGFGDRVPNDESLISLVGVAEVIRQIEPRPQPKPLVPRTKSG